MAPAHGRGRRGRRCKAALFTELPRSRSFRKLTRKLSIAPVLCGQDLRGQGEERQEG